MTIQGSESKEPPSIGEPSIDDRSTTASPSAQRSRIDRSDRHPVAGRHGHSRLTSLSLVLIAAIALVASACTVDPPPPNGDPLIATIDSFTATAPSSSSPATVTLSWAIKHLGAATATCLIESDEPGFAPIEIDPCPKNGSNVISVATDDEPRTDTFTLTVEVSVGYVLTETTTFTVMPAPEDPFDITFTGLDELSEPISTALLQAGARWESVITTGFPTMTEFPSWCQDPTDYELPESVDDLMIYVIIQEMDGPSGTLGAAGPSCILIEGERAVTGVIYLDEADLPSMDTAKLTRVMIHEIGHILGIGTLWNTLPWGQRQLLDDAGSPDPRYNGSNAVAEWHALGGSGNVPVENTGGSGTRDSHWRESVFTNEAMTGWLDSVTPLSRMTIASLADMGYSVDLDAADPFTLSAPFAGAQASAAGRGNGAGDIGDLSLIEVDHDRFAPTPMTPPVDG